MSSSVSLSPFAILFLHDIQAPMYIVGASMLSLYRSGKWALLPDEKLVDQYLAEPRGRYLGAPLDRDEFPKIEVRVHLRHTVYA